MKRSLYERPAYSNIWAREEGKGRVFYTSMGHREDVWTYPTFQSILIGAIHWVTRDVNAAVPPNLMQVAPGAMTNPVFVEPKKK